MRKYYPIIHFYFSSLLISSVTMAPGFIEWITTVKKILKSVLWASDQSYWLLKSCVRFPVFVFFSTAKFPRLLLANYNSKAYRTRKFNAAFEKPLQ